MTANLSRDRTIVHRISDVALAAVRSPGQALAEFRRIMRRHPRPADAAARSGGGPGTTQRCGKSLARRLGMLIVAVAIPLMALGAVTLWRQYAAARQRAEVQLVDHAQTLARLVDGEFDRAKAVARTIAASAALARGDLDALETELRAAAAASSADGPPGQQPTIIGVANAQGDWQLSTFWAPGERLTARRASETARSVLATGKVRISELITTSAVHLPLIGVAVPVFSTTATENGSRPVVGAISITIPRERFIPIVANVGIPPGAIVSVLDRTGAIVARSFRDAESVGRMPARGMLDAIEGAQSGVAPGIVRTLENLPSLMAFARAAGSGFVVNIAVPEEVFVASLRRTLMESAGIGMLVLFGGLGAAAFGAHRIVGSFRRAVRVATDEPGARVDAAGSTGLREADELSAALTESLKAREQAARKASALITNSPIGVTISEVGGRVLQANDAYLSIVGASRADLEAGTLFWDRRSAPECRGRDRAAVAETLRSGHCIPYEKEYVRPDGTRVPALVSVGLVDADAGEITAFVVDLRKVRAAEDARRESEALATGILGATSDRIATIDAADRLAFLNEPGRVQLEIDDLADVIGTPVVDLWPEESRSAVQDAIRQARATGRANFVGFCPTSKGTPKWWEVTLTTLPDAGGETNRLLSVVRDVTEAREAALTSARHAARRELLLQVTDAMLANGRDEHALAMLVFETVAESLEADVCINYRLDAKSGRLGWWLGRVFPKVFCKPPGSCRSLRRIAVPSRRPVRH